MRILSNQVLLVAVVSWFVAQSLKIVSGLVVDHKLNLKLFFASGGMPSSHTSTVVGLTTAVAYACGLDSVEFAISFVFSTIVMYDATGVRWQAGRQAEVLNYIMEHWHDKKTPELFQQNLKILIGHTPFQMLAGAVLGVAIGVLMNL